MKSDRKFIPNDATIVGKVVNIDSRDKATTIAVDTGDAVVNTIVFARARAYVKDLKVGDSVVFRATVQSNNAKNGFPAVSLAVNSVYYGNESKNSYSAFRLAGRLLSLNRISPERATALVKTQSNGRVNIIRVYYEAPKENVDAFCKLTPSNYILASGSFADGTNALYIKTWRHAKPI